MLAEQAGLLAKRADEIFSEVSEAVSRWPEFAAFAGVRKETSREIESFLL